MGPGAAVLAVEVEVGAGDRVGVEQAVGPVSYTHLDDELTGGDGNDIFIIGLKSGDDVITDFDDNDDLLDLSALFAISGKTEEEIFGNDDRLDEDDDFVSDSSDGLEIDIGQLFGTGDKGVDTLLIEGVSNINLDQVITTSSVA